jgi:hypothetical protein
MRVLAAALVLAFPLSASADFVHLEYEGVVNSVRFIACGCDPTRDYAPDHPEFTHYAVGDRLHGFLTIDLDAAPPDRRPLEPEIGIYSASSRSAIGGFISGHGAPLVDLVLNDSVSVRDATDDIPFESYVVDDQWSTPNGVGQFGLNIVSRRAGLDLVTGEGIAQNFDAAPEQRSRDFRLSQQVHQRRQRLDRGPGRNCFRPSTSQCARAM